MTRTLLFDLGGTLFDFAKMDTRAVFMAAGRQTYDFLTARGHNLPPFRSYFRTSFNSVILSYGLSLVRRNEFNVYHLLGKVCRRMGLSLDEPTLQELGRLWYHPCFNQSSIAPDLLPALARLRDRGHHLVIVSNTFIPGYLLDEHMHQHGLLEFFPHRIYSSEIGRRKPHPLPYRLALRAVNAMPHEAIFIGDTINTDIVGARRLGIHAVQRVIPGRKPHRLADHHIRHISELPDLIPTIPFTPDEELPPLEELLYQS